MKLKHPASKHTVETDNPEPYTAQGWVEVKAPAAKKAAAKKAQSKPESTSSE